MDSTNVVNKLTRSPSRALLYLVSSALIIRFGFYAGSRTFSTTPIDEVLAIVLAPIAILGFAKMANRLKSLFVAFGILGYLTVIFLSSALRPFSLERGYDPLVMGIIFELKPFLIFAGLFYLVSRSSASGSLASNIRGICYVLLCLAIIDLPFTIHDMIVGVDIYGQPLLKRGPFFRPSGLFHHPVSNTQTILFGAIAAATLLRFRFSLWVAVLLVTFAIAVVLTFQVKETLIVGLLLLSYIFVGRHLSPPKVVTGFFIMLVGLGGALVMPGDNPMTDHFNKSMGASEDTVRATFYKVAPMVAEDNFPLGSGVSTFGSQGSREGGYSSLYKKYGIWGLWGATEENDRYLLDTYWPKIIAESGFFGAFFLFVAVMLGTILSVINVLRRRNPVSFFAFIVVSTGVILSTAMQAFNEELIGTMFFLALSCALVHEARHAYSAKRDTDDVNA